MGFDATTVLFMSFNFFTSVAIVFVNKLLFDNYQCSFSTFVTFCHFIVTYLGTLVCERFGIFTHKELRHLDVLPITIAFCGFVVFNNLSLQYNSVGFYQLMKVLTTPVIVSLQYAIYSVKEDWRLVLALVPVIIGVALATVNDVSVNAVGTVWALAGILSTSFYQLFIKSKQDALGANSWQLLKYQAPQSALVVAFFVPVLDRVHGEKGLIRFLSEVHVDSLVVLLISSVLAFGVNLSIYLVVGRTSPISYNVLGHFKLLVVLLGGVLFMNGDHSPIVLSGMALAFVGITVYTHLKQTIADNWKSRKVVDSRDVEKQTARFPTTVSRSMILQAVSILSASVAVVAYYSVLTYKLTYPSTQVPSAESVQRVLNASEQIGLSTSTIPHRTSSQLSGMDIVIAHYKSSDNLTGALGAFELENVPIKKWIVYNKNNQTPSNSPVFSLLPADSRVISLPNVGREGHTYLHHIVKNYDMLAEHTLFCQENPHWLKAVKDFLASGFTSNTGFLGLGLRVWCNCNAVECGGSPVSGLTEMWMIVARRFCSGKWAASMEGCFVVSSGRIRRHPKSLYEYLLRLMELENPESVFPYNTTSDTALTKMCGPWTVSNPHFGHVLERSWNLIFGCEGDHVCVDK